MSDLRRVSRNRSDVQLGGSTPRFCVAGVRRIAGAFGLFAQVGPKS